MTNYQKRRDEKAEKFEPEHETAIHGTFNERGAFVAGYDQGFADALADVQPLVDELRAIKADANLCIKMGRPRNEYWEGRQELFKSLLESVDKALAHFNKIVGKE